MEFVLNIAIRFIIYIVIALPLVRGIFSGTGSAFSMIIAIVLVGIGASILEVRGIMKKLVTFCSGLLGVKLKASGGAVTSALGAAIAPDETYIECANCGSKVKLLNGQGTCQSCDSHLSINP